MFPRRPLFGFAFQPFLNCLTRTGVFFRFPASTRCSIFGFRDLVAERFDFFAERGCGIDRLGRRNERASRKGGIPSVCPMKPDAEGPSEFERGQSGGMIALYFMHGGVARLA